MEEENRQVVKNTVDKEIEEGKLRDNILESFRGIGVAEIVLAIPLFVLGIVSLSLYHWSSFENVGDGIWCTLFSIAAGIMSIITSQKVSYCTVGWSMITSCLASFFMFLLVVFQIVQFAIVRDSGSRVVHGFMTALGVAELTLSIVSMIMYIRLFRAYPYHVPGGISNLCPCCHESTNFADVMYASINPKKHDA